jgi:hypothetical protein
VLCLRGSPASQKEPTNLSSGSACEKNRCCRDSFDSEAKNWAIAASSLDWATRIEAVVPLRKINRPDSGASWVGIGTK